MKKTIVVISNDHAWTYNLRKETLEALIKEGHRVIVLVGYGKRVEDLKAMGCEFIDVPVDRHGMNPFNELKLLNRYKKILKKIRPDVVLTYTIKPNIYGGYACRKLKIPYIANITGLGTPIENKGPLQGLFIRMLKAGLKKASMVFFQNEENRDFLISKNAICGKYDLLPGSGVNLEKFSPIEYPSNETIEFVFISRLMKEKGIDQYLDTAVAIREKYPNTRFHICGFCEQDYEKRIEELSQNNVIIYHGMVDDVREVIKKCHCTVHPTYYPEGMSNVLLESSACARPIITTDRSGCREIIDDGINGFIVNQKDSNDLIEKVEKFIALPYEEKRQMGLNGRAKVEKEFDRQIVVRKYLEEINRL